MSDLLWLTTACTSCLTVCTRITIMWRKPTDKNHLLNYFNSFLQQSNTSLSAYLAEEVVLLGVTRELQLREQLLVPASQQLVEVSLTLSVVYHS